MTPERLKLYLDGLVMKGDRDFTVLIKPRRGYRLGVYYHTKKQIVVFEAANDPVLRSVATGLHELAHHLNWKEYAIEWVEMWRRHERIPRHGPVFVATLQSLIGQWNFTYRELLKGVITFDSEHATKAPKFERFEKTEHHGNKRVRGKGVTTHD